MWSYKDDEGKTHDFAGSQNVWIKRIGLFLLIIGMFPTLLVQYGEELNFVWKFIIIAFIASYTLYHLRGLIKSVFVSKK